MLTGKDTDTVEEAMAPTTARTMEAVVACGDRAPGRLPQAPATRLLTVRAESVSRATPLRRHRPWSYQVPQVPEALSQSSPTGRELPRWQRSAAEIEPVPPGPASLAAVSRPATRPSQLPSFPLADRMC